MAELTDNAIQLFCVFACGSYSCFKAIAKRDYKWLLTALFYLSFGIGLTYWVLYLVLFDSAPQVFFVSELSWTASYIFLAMRLAAGLPDDGRGVKTRLLFLVFPFFSFIMCIFLCMRGSYLENVLMGTAMAVCGFLAAKGIYLSRRGERADSPWIFYASLLFYAAEYILWISSYFWIDNTFLSPYLLTDTFILNPALILIAFAQGREDKICHTV